MVWKKAFPFLCSEMNRGHIWSYDTMGFSRELSEVQKAHIKHLESKYGLKVIAVPSGKYLLGGDTVEMDTYVYVSDDYSPEQLDDGSWLFYADVINHTWDVHEMGTVGIIERAGCVKRVW